MSSRFLASDRHYVMRVLMLVAFAAPAACSGGGAGSSPGPIAASTGPSQPSSSGQSTATFKMNWGGAPAANAVKRKPQYLAPTALSASLTVITAPAPYSNTSPIVEYLNNPTSSIAFSAPNGQDTFLIKTYDAQNGAGNLLSFAYVTMTVSSGSANIVSATMDGVISSLALGVSAPFTGGVASTATLTATGLDADNNVIVGSASFATPIQLTIVDPTKSGTLALSTQTIQTPGTTSTLSYTGKTLTSAQIVASTAGVPSATVTIAPTPGFAFYPLPSPNSAPALITADSANNLYFGEQTGNRIGELPATSATFTEFTDPSAGAAPASVAVGLDGRIWFSEQGIASIGAVTTTGTFTQYPTGFAGSYPQVLMERGDGTIWFVDQGANVVAERSDFGSAPTPAPTSIPIPTANSDPVGIAEGPDSLIYFTENVGGKIGRLLGVGAPIQEATIPTVSGVAPKPFLIAAGPDGNMWFTDIGTSAVGRVVTSSFTVTEYPTLTPNAYPVGIVAGSDGALWFTEAHAGKVGRITTAGVVTEYPVGQPGSSPFGITTRSNGTLWMTDFSNDQLIRMTF